MLLSFPILKNAEMVSEHIMKCSYRIDFTHINIKGEVCMRKYHYQKICIITTNHHMCTSPLPFLLLCSRQEHMHPLQLAWQLFPYSQNMVCILISIDFCLSGWRESPAGLVMRSCPIQNVYLFFDEVNF